MSVSTIHYNHGGKVVQAHEGAGGARIDGKHGRHLEVRYDEATDTFVIEADSSNIRVETGSNKIWVTKR